jgi:hypothetical protein
MRLSLLVRLIIESSAQQMSQANDPVAEKRLQLEVESLTQQMSQLASAKRKLEFEVEVLTH